MSSILTGIFPIRVLLSHCSLELSAGGIDVPAARTANKGWDSGACQHALKFAHPLIVRCCKWDARTRIERDQVYLTTDAAIEYDWLQSELRAAVEDRFGPLPEPVEALFDIQDAKLKLALIGADYLVFRGGRLTVGPVVLGSDDLRDLRASVSTAVYTSGRREASLRADTFREGLRMVDAILEARQAA